MVAMVAIVSMKYVYLKIFATMTDSTYPAYYKRLDGEVLVRLSETTIRIIKVMDFTSGSNNYQDQRTVFPDRKRCDLEIDCWEAATLEEFNYVADRYEAYARQVAEQLKRRRIKRNGGNI